jgi:endonuclease/exonuclease/phosphatase family metal-dependent hydrolase
MPATTLRLVTWNTSTGRLADKLSAVRRLKPDLVLLQEVTRPRTPIPGLHWAGRRTGGKGVALWTPTDTGVHLLPRGKGRPWSIPAFRIDALDLTVINVWTREEHQYVAGLHHALDGHLKAGVPSRLIVAGDFNANVIFRSDGSRRDFRTLAERLERQLDLRSAYHEMTREAYGRERQATHWFQWNARKPFHLDYCYAPKEWVVRTMIVGSYRKWRPLSDHAPLVVEYQLPEGSTWRGAT